MSSSVARAAAVAEAVAETPRTAERMGARAKRLKLDMAKRLRATREAHDIDQADVHDRQQLVSDWENAERPHAPNLLHLKQAADDERSLPYAIEGVRFVLEGVGVELVQLPDVVHATEAERSAAVTVELTDVLRTTAVALADGSLSEGDLEQRIAETRQAIAALHEQLASDIAQIERIRSTTT